MLEIPLVHGTVWINPYHVTLIEKTSIKDDVMGSFVAMDNGHCFNSPLSPEELVRKIAARKKTIADNIAI